MSTLFRPTNVGERYARELAAAYTPGRILWDVDYALANDPDVYETILRDPETRHAVNMRKHFASGRDWRVTPRTDEPADRKVSAVVEDLFGRMDGFAAARFLLADAIFQGKAYAFLEGEYQFANVAGYGVRRWWVPTRLRQIDKRRFRQEVQKNGDVAWQFFSRKRNAWEDVTPERQRWFTQIVYDDTEETLGYGRGLLEAVYFWQYAKTKVLEQGLQGIERWAQGIIAATIDGLRRGSTTRTNDDVANAWLTTIEHMRARHALVFDKIDDLKVYEANGQGAIAVKEMLEYLRTGIHVLILGSNLPSLATRGGSFALAEVQADTTEALIQFDRETIGEGLEAGAIAQVTRLNQATLAALGLGSAARPRFALTQEKKEDPEKAIKVIAALLDRGVPIREDELYSRVGLTPPGPADRTFARGAFGSYDPSDPAPPPDVPTQAGGVPGLPNGLAAGNGPAPPPGRPGRPGALQPGTGTGALSTAEGELLR